MTSKSISERLTEVSDEISDKVTKSDENDLLSAAYTINRQLDYKAWTVEEWVQCLRDAGLRENLIEKFEKYMEVKPEQSKSDSPRRSNKILLRYVCHNSAFSEWISCPECGNTDLNNVSTGYHNSVVYCPKCGESTTRKD